MYFPLQKPPAMAATVPKLGTIKVLMEAMLLMIVTVVGSSRQGPEQTPGRQTIPLDTTMVRVLASWGEHE